MMRRVDCIDGTGSRGMRPDVSLSFHEGATRKRDDAGRDFERDQVSSNIIIIERGTRGDR